MGASLLTGDVDLPTADGGVVGVGVVAVLDVRDSDDGVTLAGGDTAGTEAGGVVGEVTSESDGRGGGEASGNNNLGEGEHFEFMGWLKSW